MLQSYSNLRTIYFTTPIHKMTFIHYMREGRRIPCICVTYADVAVRDAFIVIMKEMHASQQWSHELIITDSDVSIIFHCLKLSPATMKLITGGIFTELPDNMEVVFSCAADFSPETINVFRKNYNDTDTLLLQIVDSVDNIDNGKLIATTLAGITLPVSKVH